MTRSFTIALVLALAGCDLSEELKGQPCEVDKDCSHKQHCARTDAERTLALPGVCLPKDIDCTDGKQLGCACLPEDIDRDCSFAAVPSVVEYPEMMCDATTLVCVIYDPDATSEG